MKVAVSKLPALDYYVWGSHILIRDSAPRFRRNFAARRYLVQERRISQLKHPCTLSRLWVNWEEIDWKSHETSAFYIHRWIPQKSLFAVFQTSESISCWLKPKVHHCMIFMIGRSFGGFSVWSWEQPICLRIWESLIHPRLRNSAKNIPAFWIWRVC